MFRRFSLLNPVVVLITASAFTFNLLSIRAFSFAGGQCCGHRTEVAGAIEGVVLDANGQPAPDIRVEAVNTAYTPTGPINSVLTDKNGKFTIKKLVPGTYQLYTEKDGDEYPHTMNAFTNLNPNYIPTTTVFENEVTKDIVLNLGPKAGTVIVRISDYVTGKPIKNSRINLYRIDNPIYRFSATHDTDDQKSNVKILVPPVPFSIEISAPGYINKFIKSYEVISGETKQLAIHLRPNKN